MKRYLKIPLTLGAAGLVLAAIVALATMSADRASAGPPFDVGLARAIEVQEAHTNALIARPGVVGTAVGLTVAGQPAVLVLVKSAGVRGFPATLDGVPLRVVVTGEIFARHHQCGHDKPTPGDCGGGDPTPGITVSPDSGLETTESGGSDTFTVVLDSAPLENVTIDLSSSNTDEGTVDPSALTFTNGDWNEEQTVTVTGVDDVGGTVVGDDVLYTVTALAANDGTDYDGLDAVVSVTNLDNDGVVSCSDSGTTTRRCRPVPIGVSTGHPNITAGTIGARVVDTSGNVYALSNNHVYAAANSATIGDAVIQPGTFDGGSSSADDIGTLAEYVILLFGNQLTCDTSTGDGCNVVDAAIALSSTANLDNATPSDGYGTPQSATVTPSVNLKVLKYGRTTGETKGQIAGINATVDVNYGDGNVARFVGQFFMMGGSFSAGGDSGSLIVVQRGGDALKPVGLLFAGSINSTIANPIDEVLSELALAAAAGGGVTVTIDGTP